MSRRINGFTGEPVLVETDSMGIPVCIDGWPVLEIGEHFREWVGILEGEPQADIWQIRTAQGVAELHYLCQPVTDDATGSWLRVRWED